MNRMLLCYFIFSTLTISYVIGGGNWSQYPSLSTNQPSYITGDGLTPIYCNPPYQGSYTFPNNMILQANLQYPPSVYYLPMLMLIAATSYVCNPNTMFQYLLFSQESSSQYTNVLPQEPHRATTNPIPDNHYS